MVIAKKKKKKPWRYMHCHHWTSRLRVRESQNSRGWKGPLWVI